MNKLIFIDLMALVNISNKPKKEVHKCLNYSENKKCIALKHPFSEVFSLNKCIKVRGQDKGAENIILLCILLLHLQTHFVLMNIIS